MGKIVSASNSEARIRDGRLRAAALIGVSVLLLILLPGVSPFPTPIVQAAGTLRVEIVAAYNLVVDSNLPLPRPAPHMWPRSSANSATPAMLR